MSQSSSVLFEMNYNLAGLQFLQRSSGPISKTLIWIFLLALLFLFAPICLLIVYPRQTVFVSFWDNFDKSQMSRKFLFFSQIFLVIGLFFISIPHSPAFQCCLFFISSFSYLDFFLLSFGYFNSMLIFYPFTKPPPTPPPPLPHPACRAEG